jgi:hypothetical protein
MKKLMALLSLLALPTMAIAQYQIDWYVIGAGGGTSTSTNYQLTGTIGQPIVGTSSSTNYSIDAGFWVGVAPTGGCSYIDGDVNNNGAFNGIDVTYSVGYFKGGPVPPYSCDCNSSSWFVAGDVNGNCAFNGIDVSYMVGYFKGGPSPIPCPACPPSLQESPPAPAVMPVNSRSLKLQSAYNSH